MARRAVPWRAMLITAGLLLLVAGADRCRCSREVPRARHRQGRPGRLLPGAEEHPHRARDRHLTTLVMLPFALAARHHGRLSSRLGRRRHPVRLHDAQFDSRRAADRGCGADDAGSHGHASRAASRPSQQRADAAAAGAVPDSRRDQLDRTVPAVARRDAEAARDGIHPGGAGFRRVRFRASSRATSCPT